MKHHIYTPEETHRRKMIYAWMHIIVLLLSIFLIVSISIDTFKNIAFYKAPQFMQIQFWVCILFMLDFFVEWIMAEKKWRYLGTHFLFLLVSIPWGTIINYFGWTFSPQVTYLIRYIPLVRGGYALAMVVGWLTANKATGLFLSYTISLIATLYFSSIIFFIFEQDINPLVNNYEDALWWAAMDMTTVGSNIIAVTPIGRVLSVVLAALGMMLFPIFTVYITNLIQNHNKRGWVIGEGNFLPENEPDNNVEILQQNSDGTVTAYPTTSSSASGAPSASAEISSTTATSTPKAADTGAPSATTKAKASDSDK